MNKQQIFDKVSGHLLKQNKKSQRRESGILGCAYRGNNNLKCAIGCLISNKEYSVDMEGSNVDSLMDDYPVIFKPLKRNINLLRDLQSCHDDHVISDWEEELKTIARTHRLKFSLIKKKKK